MAHDFDLVVLGAGSGGVAASRRATLHGAKVAIVEAGRVGGTCVLRGCVPKKLLMYAAQYGDALAEAAGYGWQLPAGDAAFDMAHWQAAKTAETNRLEGVYRAMLAQGGVELIEGHGRFVDAHTVAIGEHRLSARHVLIATGATPVRDAIGGIERCPTSDDLLDLAALPDRAAVIGSGYIAVEFASLLARLGVRVSLLYRADLPLRGFDEDLRRRLADALGAAGIALMPGRAPLRVDGAPGAWQLALPDGNTLRVPWLLNATGRRPNTAGLGLEAIGVATDAHAAVRVDASCRSSVPHVAAIGDVTNRKNLTPVAIAEGRAVADRLFGGKHDARVDLQRVASAVFTLPPIGTIGPSEVDLAAEGTRIRVYEADFKPMRHAFTGRGERTYMKLLVDDASDRVLAVHMIGADAPEIVQSLAVALSAGATKAQFDATVAVHPTAAEEFVLMRSQARRSA
ncbi:MAG TPA: glutathione-disulfide reductase [Burkholderiaceae bacterium]|nr:glutathione-disulfide reductase [Burkholderiaceae bacterium]